jgi:hypothetical protein
VKRLLLDLGVLLGVVLERAGAPVAAQVWAALERGRGRRFVPAHGLTPIDPGGFAGSPVEVLDPATALLWLSEG